MMRPFKWKLSACTVTFCYFFVQILENEIWKFGGNLPLATLALKGLIVSLVSILPVLFLPSPRRDGSLYVSGNLPTYPSPKQTLTPTSHLGRNVGLGEGRKRIFSGGGARAHLPNRAANWAWSVKCDFQSERIENMVEICWVDQLWPTNPE